MDSTIKKKLLEGITLHVKAPVLFRMLGKEYLKFTIGILSKVTAEKADKFRADIFSSETEHSTPLKVAELASLIILDSLFLNMLLLGILSKWLKRKVTSEKLWLFAELSLMRYSEELKDSLMLIRINNTKED